MKLTVQRHVGSSGLSVLPFGFGGGTLGSPAVSTTESTTTINAAWDLGVRFFDTAPWYGIGRSERRLGMTLGDLNRRDEFKINTKVGKTLVPEPIRNEAYKTYCSDGSVRTPRDASTGFRIHFEYTADAFRKQHHASLQRLGLSSVDSLTIHDIDYGYHTPEQIEFHLKELDRNGGGGAEALENMRKEGVIQAIGCGCNLEFRNASSWDDDAHEKLCERIADLVDLDFFVVAGAYTILETRALRRVFPLCQERGIGVIAATPFSGGWLANPNHATYMYGKADREIVQRTLALQKTCRRFGVPLAAAALQFQLANPLVAAIIPGAKSKDEVVQNHQLIQLEIPSSMWKELQSEGLLSTTAPVPE